MKEINIARTLVNMRREKGITQDELAAYIGVSKASVSKWETGQSYPDITFLPQLAAYFNISIDELMDYQPQMIKEDIRKLYIKISADFATKPFDEVMNQCRELVKKYFSCFPLLFQIGALMVNNSSVSGGADKTMSIISEAKELFVRVKKESDDVDLMKQAVAMEAFCALSLGEAAEVLELLRDTNTPSLSTETLMASAYHQTGKVNEAKSVLQVGMYQHIVALFGILPTYLMLCADDEDRFEEIYRRTAKLTDTFQLKTLHPAIILSTYLTAAQGYLATGKTDRALDTLEAYTDLATGDIYPLKLHGDEFFNLLDGWLDELYLGSALPRDERIIKQSMADALEKNPALAVLGAEPRFQSMVERLKNNCREM